MQRRFRVSLAVVVAVLALALAIPTLAQSALGTLRGVVRDQGVRRRVLQEFTDFATGSGWAVLGVCDSCVPGPAGNREYMVYLASPAHPLSEEPAADVADQIERAVAAP